MTKQPRKTRRGDGAAEPRRRAAADLIPAITQRIVAGFQPLKILLFGSQARGDAGPWSDVDLLVVLHEAPDTWQAKLDVLDSLRDLHVSADVTVTTPEEIRRRGDLVGTVLRPALREGRVLYEREGDSHIPEATPVSEEEIRKEVELWLVFAEDDMTLAERVIDQLDIMPRQSGFHAQQAAEKALKAVYIFLQIQYPFSHDLDELRNGLPAGWGLREEYPDLRELSMWAGEARYPGAQTANTRDDARRHVQQARALLTSVRRELGARRAR